MAGKRTAWILIGVVVALLVIGLWVAAFAIVAGGGPLATSQDYGEELVSEGRGDGKVALISVVGTIISGTGGCVNDFAVDNQIVAELEQAIQDDNVAGVILDLQTPGGGVVSSDNIHRKVLEARSEGTPVVALMGDVAASGGYYIAAAADEIVANPATTTGSIGVIMVVLNLEGTSEKLGVSIEVIKSGPNKDLASPFRELDDAGRQILQRQIDEAYDQFVNAVAEGREMELPKVRELADGRVYSGLQAKGLGLVDHLGGRELAFDRAKRLAEAPGADLVRYQCSAGLAEILSPFGRSQRKAIQDDLGIDLDPGLKYLWVP
jgi:protease-4